MLSFRPSAGSHCTSAFPTAVNVSALLSNISASSFKLPPIDRLAYLSLLATSAANPIPETALVIVAPKNAGKSAGLQLMMTAWAKLGHVVVDINLKGVAAPNFERLLG